MGGPFQTNLEGLGKVAIPKGFSWTLAGFLRSRSARLAWAGREWGGCGLLDASIDSSRMRHRGTVVYLTAETTGT